MPSMEIKGTKFGFSILPFEKRSNGFWARTEIVLKNPYVSYQYTGEVISKDEIEEWIFAMFRLLAGGYAREKNLVFTQAGVSIDLCPYLENGGDKSRHVRRQNDCVMSISFLMRDKQDFFGGVYNFVFHKAEIEGFAKALKEEFDLAFAPFERKRGKYLYVGVSPEGYKGCNYWYLDETKKVKAGDYVWVVMGRHNTKQVVYVDSVRYYDEDGAPNEPSMAKRVLAIATPEEIQTFLQSL